VPLAEQLADQSVAMFRLIDNRRGVSAALLLAGEAAYLRQDYERAQAIYTESLTLARQVGNLRLVTRLTPSRFFGWRVAREIAPPLRSHRVSGHQKGVRNG
jgi:hypothetical protein